MQALLKIKDWIADHFRGVQYAVPRRQPPMQLPSGMGFLTLLATIWIGFVGLIFVGGLGYVVYCFVWAAAQA